ncbi:Hsp70 family protein [Corynebacterium breve]|uniref:Hsp70 family protein n=1 Tax=Corynebacterium breve TaxID=3049799 RepID=A0ABY8VEW6_9CORY|nr:Hsp70 family protein [Corynebacterium breve]WIM67178.1 Hsp70 family protein [Corynebacterium breve]
MRFGIDFGTTRTVIAEVDRGNYPVVNLTDTLDDPREFVPTVAALSGGEIVCGWEAEALGGPNFVRSFKRLLAAPDASSDTPVYFGEESRPISEVLATYARHIVSQLEEYTDEEIEIVLGVPANARSAQRLLTLDAFRRAGATVLGLVNEPSAAGFEYTHRHSRTLNTKRTSIIVYDLGGGTFDATLLRIDGPRHIVELSTGIARLGGDDFDDVLAGLALDPESIAAGIPTEQMDTIRQAKEAIKPQTRRIMLDFEGKEAVVPVAEFYGAATPLVESTITALQPLLGKQNTLKNTDIAGIYLVGGASALPLVPRMLRETFGRRVHRSPLPTASTAVGLAIAADPESEFHLTDRLARRIGVFREEDAGRTISFDELVGPEDSSAHGEVIVTRNYQAVHNVGVFRFVEYSSLEDGSPGDFTVLAEISVPFAQNLRYVDDLSQVEVTRREFGPQVEETIKVDSDGVAHITIALDDGYAVSVTAEVGEQPATR